jgi:hypothetical protein
MVVFGRPYLKQCFPQKRAIQDAPYLLGKPIFGLFSFYKPFRKMLLTLFQHFSTTVDIYVQNFSISPAFLLSESFRKLFILIQSAVAHIIKCPMRSLLFNISNFDVLLIIRGIT